MKSKHNPVTPTHCTIVAGYSIFFILLIAVLLGTVLPFGQLLFSPHVKHLNVVITLIALSAGAILPALLAYFVGNAAITSKRKQTHHLNGVLFGLLSYWLLSFFSLFSSIMTAHGTDAASTNLRLVIINFSPVFGVLLVTLALAFFYARRHRGNLSLIYYRPYWILLILLIAIVTVSSIVSSYLVGPGSLFTYIPLVAIALFGSISYATLRKSHLTTTEKLAWSGISVTILFTIMFVLAQLTAELISRLPVFGVGVEIAIALAVIAISLIGWWVYWHTTAAGLRRRP